MTRQQRAIQSSRFEKLCFLRDLYRIRGAYDSVSCISIENAILAAEAALAEDAPPRLGAAVKSSAIRG